MTTEYTDPCNDAGRLQSPRPAQHRPDAAPQVLAVANCQTQLQVAIGYLHALLNSQRTAVQSWEAECEASNWLQSIGSEPK